MSITGSLSDFSVPEILHFIERGRKTGLLTIQTQTESPANESSVHYIWVERGYLVAAATQLDQQGLVKLIEQRHWVSNRVINKLAQLSPTDIALGRYLLNQSVLQVEQLKELFLVQVLQPVYTLFQLKEGSFKFEQNVSLPRRELTGLSISAGFPKHFATSLDALAGVLIDGRTVASLQLPSFNAHLIQRKPQSLVGFLRQQAEIEELAFES